MADRAFGEGVLWTTPTFTCCGGGPHRLPCPFAKGYVGAAELAAALERALKAGPIYDTGDAREVLERWKAQEALHG